MNNLNPILIELLKLRGVTEETDMLEFLSDKPQKTYNPFLLHHMEEGVDLILSTIKQNGKICIYGDYDADGITAISLMWQVLMELTDNLCYYIPSRFDEGYGLNKEAIDTIKRNGSKLILTVDCGSVSYEEVEYAKKIGLNIMVTDHHSLTDKIPECILINPKHPQCNYPFKNLAGVGVAFKLAQAIQQKAKLPKRILTQVLDLVALGTIGDIVPLVDENRTMVKFGMKVINIGKRDGLNRLIKGISLKAGEIKSDNISYGIVPHLNAAGRMVDAKIAVELLISKDEGIIDRCVLTLIDKNKERKKVQESTYLDCIMLVEEQCVNDNFIIVNSNNAHEGIAGIVAGKLKDKYLKPTVVVTPSGENSIYLKGTGRSVETVNLYDILKSCDDLFEKFGGHGGACGFLMKKENIKELRKRTNEKIDALLEEDNNLLHIKTKVDMILGVNQVTADLANSLELLAPFGHKNNKPMFKFLNMKIENVHYMGSEEQHARFTVTTPCDNAVSCVLFNKAKEYKELLEGTILVDVVGAIDLQEWNGSIKVQIIVANIERQN